MKSIEENIFVVGPQASGMSFFGRQKEIADIETSIFGGVGAIHLVGPTRIGKSSLVNKVFEENSGQPFRICVQVSMGESVDAPDFWKTFADDMQNEIRAADIWNDAFNRHYNAIEAIDYSSDNWFMRFKGPFRSIFKQLQKSGYRLVMSIDEFDSVERVFDQQTHYFQLLRSIFSEPGFVTSGVIISRRRLQLLESNCKDISTYHGVFREMTLHVFNDEDMKTFYEALNLYDLHLSSGGKKKFERYTGRMPYLCCMFAERMVNHYKNADSIGDKEVTTIFKECLPQIDRYYDDLIDRLDYDGHTEIIFYLSASSKLPSYITTRDIEHLKAMGVLISETNDQTMAYYAYSKDFMTYFRMQPLKLPALDTMTQSEKKLKEIFKKEYPKLDEYTYDDLQADVENKIKQTLKSNYPELKLKFDTIKTYCEDLSAHKDHPTILDVLTLSFIVNNIETQWSRRFHKYFGGNQEWINKLKYIKDIRNPIAHASIEYVSPEDLSACLKYCEEIIRLDVNFGKKH